MKKKRKKKKKKMAIGVSLWRRKKERKRKKKKKVRLVWLCTDNGSHVCGFNYENAIEIEFWKLKSENWVMETKTGNNTKHTSQSWVPPFLSYRWWKQNYEWWKHKNQTAPNFLTTHMELWRLELEGNWV